MLTLDYNRGYNVGRRDKLEAFQGNLKKKSYFEGWYNKTVDDLGVYAGFEAKNPEILKPKK